MKILNETLKYMIIPNNKNTIIILIEQSFYALINLKSNFGEVLRSLNVFFKKKTKKSINFDEQKIEIPQNISDYKIWNEIILNFIKRYNNLRQLHIISKEGLPILDIPNENGFNKESL
jgi:hypothetical protein